jgi:hypothetical protein
MSATYPSARQRLRRTCRSRFCQLNCYFAFTLEVIAVITLDAILNWSLRFTRAKTGEDVVRAQAKRRVEHI